MRSSTGKHFVALDHIRAFAAFMVLSWHFLHYNNGYPVPFDRDPIFLLSIFNEGHTGVALFMTLSGYLFAKLLNEKRIRWSAFFYNRALRLLPLLIFVIIVVGLRRWANGVELETYIKSVLAGAVKPTLPNGGWSITAEVHFYIVLPLILWGFRKHFSMMPYAVLLAIAVRLLIWQMGGDIKSLSYLTIVGRIDQFILGILAFHASKRLNRIPTAGFLFVAAFLVFWGWFDNEGGYYAFHSTHAREALWIVIPTIEGLTYAYLIAWYDSLTFDENRPWVRVLAWYGDASYSIYLLHTFFVFKAARFINQNIMDISNAYAAIPWALFVFLLMAIPAYATRKLIEEPFLRLRTGYIKD